MICVHNTNTTLEDLCNIPLKRPVRAGNFWKGIPHGTLVDTILGESERRGWSIGEAKCSVSKDGTDMAVAFDVHVPKLKCPTGIIFGLGVLANNNRERALRLYAGGTVTVCTNGFVSGEILLNKKHTSRLRLEEEIESALDEYISSIRGIQSVVNELKEYKLHISDFSCLLVRAGQDKLMPWSRLGVVDKQFWNPSFECNNPGTSWRLLNAFTYVCKRNPPRKQMDQINKFRKLLPIRSKT